MSTLLRALETAGEGFEPGNVGITEEEQDKVARAIVDQLEGQNWKIEQGPPREGHGPQLMPK
jgi:hypothetical protein